MTAHRPTHRTTGARLGLIAVVGLTLALSSVAGTGVLPAGAAPVTAGVARNVITNGETINVTGTVSPAAPGTRVAIERRLPSGTWSTRAVGTTNGASRFSVPIKPTGTGIYALRIRSTGGYSPIFYLRVLGPLVLDQGGIGPLRLGMTLAQAKATHWVTGTTPGCELSGATAATFPAGVKVSAEFSGGKISNISLYESGATVEGAKIGGTLASLMAAYPAPTWTVVVDSTTLDAFGVKFVAISRLGVTRYGATVNPTTNKVNDLWVPTIAVCE